MLKLFNSLTRQKEEFVPINAPNVGVYACGMTVYDYAHIGHGRKYVIDDVLRRTLTLLDYKVTHVQNVTDVGHLVSDADDGEDKLEKGAAKTGKTVWEVAEFFTNHFYKSMDQLNILRPDVVSRATDHIEEQVELIQKLEGKGYAYDTPEAVYFDVSKFPEYGQMFGQKLEDKKTAVREEVKTGEHKKNAHDFVLWFKRVGRFENHAMHWDSPWGDGFPGWHIECSAMSMKYLGEQFDIHTGGEDHKPIHHPNEIAQSEAATGKRPFVRYWLHTAFLNVDGKKMSKSLGNYYTVEDIVEKGFDPIALRYLYLSAHYRDPLNFTFESLDAAQNALSRLKSQVASYKSQTDRTALSEEKVGKIEDLRKQFLNALNDDLNTAQALAVVWEALKSNIPTADKYDLILYFDEVLGLGVANTEEVEIPDDIQRLVAQREEARKAGDFIESDRLRNEIKNLGYLVEDSSLGVKIRRG